MEYKSAMLLPLAVVFMFALIEIARANACTQYKEARNPKHDDSEDKKVYYADYVVFGTAGRTKKGDTVPATVDGVRTIEFDVTCVYKRIDPVPTKIFVTSIGNKRNQIPNCPPAPLKAGESAVMYLSKVKSSGNMVEDLFQVEFTPNSNPNITNDQKLDDLTILCNLTKEVPVGGEDDDMCFDPLEPENCFSYQTTTTLKPVTTPEMTTKKPVMVVTAEPKTMPPKTMPPKTQTEPTKGNPVDVKPVKGGDKDAYNTQNGDDKTGPSGEAPVNVLSQSLVLLISVLFVLV